MPSNGIGSQIQVRLRSLSISGVALRVLVAFIISWLIMLAFFVSSVVSH
ncbi:MAG TPA: hypothetical protein VF844_04160 [Ktedonobacteraceae bacterium]